MLPRLQLACLAVDFAAAFVPVAVGCQSSWVSLVPREIAVAVASSECWPTGPVEFGPMV